MGFDKSQLVKTIHILQGKDCPQDPKPAQSQLKKTLSRIRAKKR